MRVITLRNIPTALTRIIRRRAAEERTSINKTVIRLLEESLGSAPGKPRKKDRGLRLHCDSDTKIARRAGGRRQDK